MFSFVEPVSNKSYKLFPAKDTSWHVRPSKDSDQPAHPRSLIRVFNGHSTSSQELTFLQTGKLRH